MAAKVFILGLDGASPDVIDALLEQGKLPGFKAMRDKGVWARLRTTVPPITGSAWSSFMTGQNPGKHGIFDFIYRKSGTYELAPINGALREGRSFWSIAGKEGKRVCIVNVPVTYPPEVVNGIMVSGMLTPAGRQDFAYPQSVAKELDAITGGYRIHITESYSVNGEERFLRHLYEVTGDRKKVMRNLMEREDWDLFMIVFQGIDVLQHELWHSYDRGHFRHGESKGKYADTIPEFYGFMDETLGEILAGWGGTDRYVMVMSDHGAGPLKKLLYLNNFLLDRGYLKLKQGAATRLKEMLFRLGFAPMTFYHVLLAAGLGRLKHKARFGQGSNWLKKFFLSFQDVDWGRTKAYAIGTTAGQIYLNVEGREPQGIVRPGEEYERVRNGIINDLKALQDPDTGEPVTGEIHLKEDLYHGPLIDRAPDLVFLPQGLEIAAFGEYEFASHRIIDASRALSGSHRMEGILAMTGGDLKGGTVLDKASIIDCAPTILHLMGLPVPSDMDGAVLEGALTDEALAQRPIVYSESSGAVTERSVIYTPEEEEELKARLKSLGYFE
jgi:predicted AlkP superfamily phosphohydrolase/phosphomutase